jgi:hypothetical protein
MSSAMNRMDPIFPARREARLRYLDHEFEVLSPGEFVRCGVSGDPISVDELRYWNIAQQMPFKTAEYSFQHYLKTAKA